MGDEVSLDGCGERNSSEVEAFNEFKELLKSKILCYLVQRRGSLVSVNELMAELTSQGISVNKLFVLRVVSELVDQNDNVWEDVRSDQFMVFYEGNFNG